MLLRRIIDGIVRRFDWYVKIPLAHKQFDRINILNSIDSIKYIIEHKCSVSRYGDGEIVMLFGGGYSGYQGADKQLAKRLKQVLQAKDAPNHVIGMPLPLKTTSNLRHVSKEFWDYFTMRRWKRLLPFLSSELQYVDTQLSRFYIIYDDKSHCKKQIELLKMIWNDRDVVIIEGAQSRTGIGNDLYSNTKSIKRIVGYATDAFSHYDKMLKAVVDNVSKDKLILLSYGPTATILAYDLAKLGYQAIDLGHLDIEYEWFKMGAIDKVAINGKFINEAEGGRLVKSNEEKEYLQQIIFDITSI